MHLLMLIAGFVIGVTALASAIVKTCVDLLERGPYEAPLLNDEALQRPKRQQPDAAVRSGLDLDLARDFDHLLRR